MKQPTIESVLLEVLEGSLRSSKDYKQIVEDGAAIERLQANSDFRRYQRLLAEAYLLLVERMRLADPATLPALQGALVNHHVIMRLPAKVLELAVKMVERERQDREAEMSERGNG